MAAIIAQLTRTARKRQTRKSYGANKCLYSLQPFSPNGFDPAVHNKYGLWWNMICWWWKGNDCKMISDICMRRRDGRNICGGKRRRRRRYGDCGGNIRSVSAHLILLEIVDLM